MFLLFSVLSIGVYGQGNANIWYFGKGAGLDFNTIDGQNNPLILDDGPNMAVSEGEGSAAYSDAF